MAEYFNDHELRGRCYCRDENDVRVLIRILVDEDGYMDATRNEQGAPMTAGLNVKGALAAEELGTSGSDSAQGFVAMWFDPAMTPSWTNGFDPGIRNAGYRPIRIDAEEYVGGVSDRLIAEIRRSRFLVADYTGQRNGVYFEAGFALGLPLIVIPTCRQDHVANLHFDIKHLNTLVWNDPPDLATKLERRIRAVVGAGPTG
jgi:hypothetical protein